MAKLVKARVLVDIAYAQIKCGQVIQAEDKVIKALADGGIVDGYPDAVAYAEAHGQKAVDLPNADAALEVAVASTETPTTEQ